MICARHHKTFNAADGFQIFEIARHRLVVIGMHRGTKSAATLKVAFNALVTDQRFDVVQHVYAFAQHGRCFCLAAQRNQPFDAEFLISAANLAAIARARTKTNDTAIEHDCAATGALERQRR